MAGILGSIFLPLIFLPPPPTDVSQTFPTTRMMPQNWQNISCLRKSEPVAMCDTVGGVDSLRKTCPVLRLAGTVE